MSMDKENLPNDKEKPIKTQKKEGLFARIKKIKHIEIIVAVGAVLIMLVIYFAGFGGFGSSSKKNNTSADGSIYSDYCTKMQAELTDYVSKIKGAGRAKAIINWESGVELIIASSQSSSSSSHTSTPIVITNSGSSNPIVLKELYPKAVGVVVVCEGGGNAAVKVNIIMSVSTLLNIGSEKIVVLPMQKGK